MNEYRLPPLAALRAFESAARLGSFSAAGRELGVTHAAVSQQVRRLEELLERPLARRQGRGLELSPEGERLALRLREGFAAIREGVAELRAEQAARPVHVSMTPSFAVSWLMPRIGEFRAEHPQVELMLNPSADLVDLVRDGYDLAIRYGSGAWPGVDSELLVPSSFAVVAAASLVEQVAVQTPADLMRLPWLQELGTDELGVWLAARGVTVAGKQDVTHLPGYLLLPALRDGQGVACMSQVVVEDDLQAGTLVALFDDGYWFEKEDPGAPLGYHLVYRSGVMREPLRLFVQWLKRVARVSREQGGG